MRIRVGGIIIKGGKILLIRRKKEGREYYVFPGGGVEKGETRKQAVSREVNEKTGLFVKTTKFAFCDFSTGIKQVFYFLEVEGEKVVLGGPEAKRNSEENQYFPVWISLEKIGDLNLLPESAKGKLLNFLRR